MRLGTLHGSPFVVVKRSAPCFLGHLLLAKLTHARFCYGAARLLGCKRRTLLNHLRIGLQLTITRLAGLNQRGLRLLDLQGESCNTIAPTNQAGDVVLNDIQSTAEALRHVHSLARQLTHPLQTKQLSKQLLDFRGLVASNRPSVLGREDTGEERLR